MLNRFAQPKRLDGVMQAVWRIVAALLAVLLVVGALAATPIEAIGADGFHTITDDKLDTSKPNRNGASITVKTYDAHGGQQDVTLPNADWPKDKPLNIVPDSDMKITVKGLFHDIEITKGEPDNYDKFNLKWEYPLPFSKQSAGDGNMSQEVMDGNFRVGSVELAEGADGMAVVRIEYDLEYLKQFKKNSSFYFSYDMSLKVTQQLVDELKQNNWKFPGTDNVIGIPGGNIDVELGRYKMSGGKQGTVKPDGTVEWGISITAPAILKNVTFIDTFGEDTTVNEKSIEFLNGRSERISPDTLEFTQSTPTSKGVIKATFTEFDTKGWGSIRYTGTIRKDAQVENNMYKRGGNDVEWIADNADRHTAHADLSIATANYQYMQKYAAGELDADGYITWTVRLNYGNDKFDLGGHVFVDTLQQKDGKHEYVGNAEVYKVVNGHDEHVKTITLPEHAQSFTYEFPADAGAYEYKFVYKTQPERPTTGNAVYRNDAQLKDEYGNQVGGGNGSFTIVDDMNQQLITKQVDGTPKLLEGHDDIYTLDWKVEFNPDQLGNLKNKVTEFKFDTDEITSANAGTTSNMWFTKSTIDFKIEEKHGSEWRTISTNDTSYQGDELVVIGNLYQDAGYPLPDGVEKPANKPGVFKVNYYRIPQNKVFDKPLRITYTSLFDGAPDIYVNHAKVSFKIEGMQYEQTASAEYTHTAENYVGKTANPNRYGKYGWNDNAQWVSPSQYSQNPSAYSADCEQGCWIVDWGVWGNSLKPWWSTVKTTHNGTDYHTDVSAHNALRDLENVRTITMTDTLPAGWKLDTSAPVGGYFAAQPAYDVPPSADTPGLWNTDKFDCDGDLVKFKSEYLQYFKLSENGQCTAANGQAATCGTWSEQSGDNGNTVVLSLPNDGTLSEWTDTKLDNVKGLLTKQSLSNVVFTFRAVLPYDAAHKQGVQNANTVKFVNHASMTFDEQTVGNAQATVTVANQTSSMLQKKGEVKKDNANNATNVIQYTVTVNGKDIPHFCESETFTLADELKSPEGYAGSPYASFAGNFNVKLDGNPLQEGEHYSVKVSKGENKWQSAELQIQTQPQVPQGNGNPGRFEITYDVKLKGVSGDYLPVNNHVQISGQYGIHTQHTDTYRVLNENAILGAIGTLRVRKVNESMQPIQGAGSGGSRINSAIFEMCQVDLDKHPTTNMSPEHCVGGKTAQVSTDENGYVHLRVGDGVRNIASKTAEHATVTRLETNTLYVLWEVKAPAGHELDSHPHYFMFHEESDDATNGRLTAIQTYRETHKLVVSTQTEFDVMNPKTPEPEVVLPETGGRGRSLWAAMFATLAVGFGALMAMRVRNGG